VSNGIDIRLVGGTDLIQQGLFRKPSSKERAGFLRERELSSAYLAFPGHNKILTGIVNRVACGWIRTGGEQYMRILTGSFWRNEARSGGGRFLMAAFLVVPLLSTTSAGIAIAPVSAAVDALSVLAARSPGLRGAGALSTKRARLVPSVGADDVSGTQVFDNLPSGTPMAPLPAAVPLPADVAPVGAAMLPPNAFAQIPTIAEGAPVGIVSDGGGTGGGGGTSPATVFPGSGGGGGGGGGGIIVTPTPVTPASPVPEPSLWMMLLSSFLLFGPLLRWRLWSSAAAWRKRARSTCGSR
jgi:hypothetical protein